MSLWTAYDLATGHLTALWTDEAGGSDDDEQPSGQDGNGSGDGQ